MAWLFKASSFLSVASVSIRSWCITIGQFLNAFPTEHLFPSSTRTWRDYYFVPSRDSNHCPSLKLSRTAQDNSWSRNARRPKFQLVFFFCWAKPQVKMTLVNWIGRWSQKPADFWNLKLQKNQSQFLLKLILNLKDFVNFAVVWKFLFQQLNENASWS